MRRPLLIVCILLFNVFNIGAGSSSFPEGDGVKTGGVKPVSHGLNLPPGYALLTSSLSSMPEISTDYQNHFPNPKSFEHPKDILSKGLLPKNRLVSFLFMHNSKVDLHEIEKLAGLYMKEADYEGVNYDIAFIQMCLETGFLKFNG
ncbi:MAG: hypothetical protein Q8T08_19745, partial [Ignavibacteria bacterium]|nr:hypothetical protein [Ignavibacteria bacterium]